MYIVNRLHRPINLGSQSLPRITRKNFLLQINASSLRSTLLTMSCPPKCDLLHLPRWCLECSRNHFGSSHVSVVFMFLLLLPHLIQRYLFAASHHNVRCIFRYTMFFGDLVYALHNPSHSSTTMQPCLRHISSVQPPFLFCKLICFLVAFGDELTKEGHLLHFPLGAICFDVLDLHQNANSRSTSPRLSLLDQCTSLLLSTARQ